MHTLISAPNILILDEPTNDLDITTLSILEDYLDGFDGVVITVSHDRYFLDQVTNKIVELTHGRLYSYVGGFLTGGAKWLVTGLLILFALGFMIALGKQLYEERSKKKNQANGETAKAEDKA